MKKFRVEHVAVPAVALFFGWILYHIYLSNQKLNLERDCDLLESKYTLLSEVDPSYISSEVVDGECFVIESFRFQEGAFSRTKLLIVQPADIEAAWARRKK